MNGWVKVNKGDLNLPSTFVVSREDGFSLSYSSQDHSLVEFAPGDRGMVVDHGWISDANRFLQIASEFLSEHAPTTAEEAAEMLQRSRQYLFDQYVLVESIQPVLLSAVADANVMLEARQRALAGDLADEASLPSYHQRGSAY